MQIHSWVGARVKRAQRLAAAAVAVELGVNLIILIGRESVELEAAILVGDVSLHRQCLRVFQIDHGVSKRSIVLAQDRPGKRACGRAFLGWRRSNGSVVFSW